MQGFAAFQPDLNRCARAFHHFDMRHFFIEAHGDTVLLRDIGQRGGHFMVKERQQDRALVDNGHPNTKCCKHCGIFHTDHAGADYNQ